MFYSDPRRDSDLVASNRLLFEIKDVDTRISVLHQGRTAVDRGLHIGGAFSAVVPAVATFYSGVMNIRVEDPTEVGQDMFVLSKGHGVATLASIMADLGYFSTEMLENSRSIESTLNGHPGPVLPGVPIATGPEGHGLPVAQGFAVAGRHGPRFDVFCLTGDGEMQAGMIWEAVMYAGQTGLDNLCVLVDKNGGQLDDSRATSFPMAGIERWLSAFGWRTYSVDATGYDSVVDALVAFKTEPRNGHPTAIVCNTKKGWGGFSDNCAKHKTTIDDDFVELEVAFQEERRAERADTLHSLLDRLPPRDVDAVVDRARYMRLCVDLDARSVRVMDRTVVTGRAKPRDKRVVYDAALLPVLDGTREYMASDIVHRCMAVFSRSGRVASVDSDLSTTSGLQAGVASSNAGLALNVGVAESNMISIGEAFAALGYNTWVSTFCPFFDWRVMRRIAIDYQERAESINNGQWLSAGHNLDIVFLATAPNFETKTNGATHMGNDDALLFSEIAHVKIIDISCPQQLIAAARWVMEGNRGLVYMRIMRAASNVLYGPEISFEYGTAYRPIGASDNEKAIIVSSGRGVHEAIAAKSILEQRGVSVGVVDMPSFDPRLLTEAISNGVSVIFAEQNNGYLWKRACEESSIRTDAARVHAINTRARTGDRQFVHSATYGQLLDRYSLSPNHIANSVAAWVS